MINHTEEREAKVQELCKSILMMSPDYEGVIGGVLLKCPLCGELSSEIRTNNLGSLTGHHKNCPVLIAKDLTTGVK